MPVDSFSARGTLDADDTSYSLYRLDALPGSQRLPYSLKVLLENLLRHEDGGTVTADQIAALAGWDPGAELATEVQFTPARVLMQDFTGVPRVVDLVAMREAMAALGGDPALIDARRPVELVIDHSVIADHFGSPAAFSRNVELEYRRNRERYQFLRWGQSALRNLRVVPPGTGICHQVNLEHLARVVFAEDGTAFPDTLVGTDSHTPMINGLGVLGWGVGGIEAEAAMLGRPVSMLIPKVVGVRLTCALPEGSTATDLVLTIAERLRQHGVVGAFVEFYGPGVAEVPLATRATIGNMSPEYGATCAIFPIDVETLSYLRLTGRDPGQVALVEAYAKEQGLWHDPSHTPDYSQTLEVDLSAIVPSIAGPKRPQDRIPLSPRPTALCGRSVEGALATTAVQAVIDTRQQRIAYSSAGHRPPVLLHPDGTCDLLDQATDPPRSALAPEHVSRPQADLPYSPSDNLVLYTDRLIERRDQDIDVGLRQLTDALAGHARLSPDRLADALLTRLGVAGGARDDIALIVVRL